MFLLAAALAASNPMPAHDAYQSCIVDQAVRLGSSNAETADTILRAVRSVCEPQWAALQQAMPGGTGVASWEQIRAGTLANWRTEAENAAVAALLEARAKRP